MESTQGTLETHIGPLQRSRWVFTINNYRADFNIRGHLSKSEFKIKRAVWGFEVGECGTHHIQGYLELLRSHRLSFVKKIFTDAYWNAARMGPLENFEYCTKEGNYDCVGDFSDIFDKRRGKRLTPASVPMILAGLMDRLKKPQIIASKTFSDRHLYFERAERYLFTLERTITMFEKWSKYKIYPWQNLILKKVMQQPSREVLWVSDVSGNVGKTFLANVLSILYGFTLLNDNISTHNIGPMLKNVKGFAFDIPRSKLDSFDYGLVECVKNGYVASGKYNGIFNRFEPVPVVIFANSLPLVRALSQDRWRIVELGTGEFEDMTQNVKLDYPSEFDMFEPPKFPDLNDYFDLRSFLQGTTAGVTIEPNEEISSTNENLLNGAVYRAGTSAPDAPDGEVFTQTSIISEVPSLPIRPQNPPICDRHPDQSVFRKGCPCLTKRVQLDVQDNNSENTTTEVLRRIKRPVLVGRSSSCPQYHLHGPPNKKNRVPSITRFLSSLE